MPVQISAILPTRNRAHYLPRVLDSLRAQTLDKSAFEIVAVDDGSTDETAALLSAVSDLPVRLHRQNHAGLATAKNLGVFAAKGPIVTFLDDDDILAPGNLEAHLAIHRKNPATNVAVLGLTDIEKAVRTPLMQYVTDTAGLLFFYQNLSAGDILDYTSFWGGRSSCKRDFIVSFGAFNPIFKFGYEDIECGYRMRTHGFKVIFEPKAHSTMIRAIDFDGFCNRSYRQGKAAHAFHEIHPAEEIATYLQIDPTLQKWKNFHRGFARIVRRAAEADKAAIVAPPKNPAGLHDLYKSAFSLCYAKGLADAAWQAKTNPTANQSRTIVRAQA